MFRPINSCDTPVVEGANVMAKGLTAVLVISLLAGCGESVETVNPLEELDLVEVPLVVGQWQ